MKITAPWSPEQVAALQAWQDAGYVHELTCRHNGLPAGRKHHALVAQRDGLWCPTCGHIQTWAPAMCMNGPPPKPDILK
jgi:hypothetical protein